MPTGKRPKRQQGSRRPAPKSSSARWLLAGAMVIAVIAMTALLSRLPKRGAQTAPAATASQPAAEALGVQQPPSQPVAASAGSPAPSSGSEFMPVTPQNGVISLPVAELSAGRARFYTVQARGKAIPFFVVEGPDGVVRAAFDACDICFAARKGYHQEEDFMVCNNCGNTFPIDLINVEKGGCNPVPLNRTVEGSQVVIALSDLEAGARYF